MGPKTTPSLISKGGYQIPPPLGGREIDTPWEIGLMKIPIFTARQSTNEIHFCITKGYPSLAQARFSIILILIS